MDNSSNNSNTTTTTTPVAVPILPIIKTSLGVNNKLEFNEVVLKETYVLRNFKLINTVDYPVQIKLKSDLSQIAFQLTNENMQDDSDETPIQDDDYNQLFNEVNLTDTVTLAPKEIKNIVISYRPFDHSIDQITTSNNNNNNNNNEDNKEDKEDGNNDENKEEQQQVKETTSTTNKKNDRFNYFEVKGKIYFQIESLSPNVELVNGIQKELVVDVMIRICKSLLKLDLNELIFDDCIVGQTYVKDLTIWNKCEMPLRFSTYYKEKFSNYFQFTDYATGLPLSEENRIVQSYSSMTIRVTYQPTIIGQFTYKFKLENKNDSNSYEIVLIHSSVSAEQQIELLQVSNNILDLGDCYTDIATFQTFTIKNISEESIDINFSSDLINNHNHDDQEVTFHFHEDDVDKSSSSSSSSRLSIIGGDNNRSSIEQDDLIKSNSSNSNSGTNTSNSGTGNSGNNNANSSNSSGSIVGKLVDNSGTIINGGNSNSNSSNNIISTTVNNTSGNTSSGINTNNKSIIKLSEKIEELTINPGSERIILVRYCPKPLFPMIDIRSTKLMDKNFRILLKYGKSSLKSVNQKNKTIRVSSRVCTSVVKIPLEINLGDCTVGTNKGYTIELLNLSDVAASMQVRFQSKVVSFKNHTFTIPPKQSFDLQMDFLPRKNNPDYRKQITFLNLTNPTSSEQQQQFLEVRSNNIDEHSVSLHSKFYHLETSYNKSYIDFDETIVNCPTVRSFSIKNVSKGNLKLNLSTSLPDEFKLYIEEKEISTLLLNNSTSFKQQQNIQDYLSNFFEGGAGGKDGLDKSKVVNSQYLDLALIPKSTKDKQLQAAQQAQLDSGKQTATTISPSQQSPQQQSQDLKEQRKKKLQTSHDQSNPNSRTNSRASSPSFDSSNNNKQDTTSKQDKQDSNAINLLNNSSTGFNSGSLSSYSATNIPFLNNDSTTPSTNEVDTTTPTTMVTTTSTTSTTTTTINNNITNYLSSSELNQFIQSFEFDESNNNPPLFTESESENQYITSQINRLKKLDTIISSGQLKKLELSTLEITQQSEVTIFLVSTVNDQKRPWLGGKLKNMECKLFISLVSLNDIPIDGESPIREVNIGTKICKSIMDLAQRNINFGNIIQYDYRTKSLVINNLSQVPLIYRIKKSGSITSGNLNIETTDRMGIVRPYRKREIQFVFKPTFSGVFDEKLIIENVYDNENNQTVHIKANVKKPRHFFLNTLDIDFSIVLIKGKSITKRITLTNTSNQRRIFKIIDDSPSSFESCINKLYFKLEEKSAFSISKETEMEIDLLERKLKICRRKGQHEKALKINMNIEKLRNLGSITPNPISRATSPTPLDDDGSIPTTNQSDDQLQITTSEPVSSNTSMVKKQFCKIGDNSITFEVEGGGIQNVLVYFSPVPKPGKRQWYGKEEGNGSILIYESKNIDVTKKINYVATVCFDEETYRQNLISTNSIDGNISSSSGGGGINNSSNSIHSFKSSPQQQHILHSHQSQHHVHGSHYNFNPIGRIIPSPPPPPLSPGINSSLTPIINNNQLNNSNILSNTTSIFKPLPTKSSNSTILTISPNKIDLGEVRIYEDISFRFSIINHTGYKVPFDLNVKLPSSTSNNATTTQAIIIKEKSGIIEPYGKKLIEVVCQPQISGKQNHTIIIISNQYQFETQLIVSLSSRPPQYIMFPDLPVHTQILDFGNCYYDKSQRFSKVLPFRLDNLSHKSLYISMKSNLIQQVFVFCDQDKLSKPADNLFIGGYEKSVVQICLKPSMTSENYVDGHCRELVGGIRIKVFDESHNLLYENTIKFTSIVGKSILRVAKNLIDLGSTRQLGETISSSLTISNVSTLLPLNYQITASKNLKLNSKLDGLLEGSDSVNHSLSKEKIHFSLVASVYGLYEERITITNLNCSGQKIEVIVRLLVDDESLTTNLPINMNGGGDMLRFDDIYVSPVSWNEKVAAGDRRLLSFNITPQQYNQDSGCLNTSDQLYQLKQFTMKNYLKYDIRIYPKSNINVYLFFHEPTTDEIRMMKSQSTDRKKSMRLCAKPFVLTCDQKIIAYPHPPEPDSIITTKQKLLLCKGRKVKFQGTLVFERSDSTHYPIAPGEGKTHISKLVSLSGSYCMSMGEILIINPTSSSTSSTSTSSPFTISNNNTSIDIGRVGYENSWKEIYITSEIKNLSEIPLIVRVTSLPSSSIRILLNHPSSNLTSPSSSSNSILPRIKKSISTKNIINGSGDDNDNIIIEFQIPSSESKQIIIAIDPTKIEQSVPGTINYPIQFENVMNEFNTMSINVQLYHTFRVLNFGRLTTSSGNTSSTALLSSSTSSISSSGNEISNNTTSGITTTSSAGGSTNGDIILPCIYHPPLIGASSQSDEWFTIENTSNKSLKINTEVELFSQFSELILVELVHKTTNTPIPSFSLRPLEVIEVRIRAKPRPDSRLKERSFDELTTFGRILLNTSIYPIEVIQLKGTILPGHNFSLSLNRLNFNLMSRITNKEGEEQSLTTCFEDYFKIKNTSTHYPLIFKVEPIFNKEVSSSSSGNSSSSGKEITSGSSGKESSSSSTVTGGGKEVQQVGWTLPTDCIIISPLSGEIPPNEMFNINVNIDLSNIDDIPASSSFVVLVTAVNSLNNETQKVSINVIGNYKPIPNTTNSPTTNVTSSSTITNTPSTNVTSSSSLSISNSNSGTPTSTSSVSTPISISSQSILPLIVNDLSINNTTLPLIASTTNTSTTGSGSTGGNNGLINQSVGLIEPISTGSIINLNKLPKLTLRGCTPISRLKNCYEIHLSQQEFSSGSIPWELTLENVSKTKPVEYSIYSMKENDDTWINLSRNSGKIEPHGRHIIIVNFSTKRIDMYSTYLIIENRNNPADIKTIQITFDVVVKQNSHFSVLVEGKQNNAPLINLGDVFYNITYTDRSFIVSNSSSMPLDFMLSTSLSPNDTTEVCFSLSRSYLRQFNTLYVEPNSQVKVFVYFHVPSPVNQSSSSSSTDPSPVTVKDIKIFLNCRLIRDYQQVINLSATCRFPQIKLSDQNIVFKGKIIIIKDSGSSSSGGQPTIQPSPTTTLADSNFIIEKSNTTTSNTTTTTTTTNTTNTTTSSKSSIVSGGSSKKVDIEFDDFSNVDQQVREISISNNTNEELSIVVKANTIFFIIDPPSNGIITIDPLSSSCITVRPNIPVILEHSNLLLKEKYLEEHIFVYNKNSLTEKYVISLRITTGQLTSFSASSGLKGGYHYRSLEQLITKFIRKFKKFWYSLYLYCIQTNNQQAAQQALLLQQQKQAQAQAQQQLLDQDNSQNGGGLNSSQNSLLMKSSSLLSLITNSDSNWTTSNTTPTTTTTTTTTNSTATTPTTNTSVIFGSTKLTSEEIKELENIFDILENDSTVAEVSHEHQQSIFHESYQKLLFDLHHITNELVLYGLKKQVGLLPSQLATLFYFNLFKHGVFKVILKMKRQLSKSTTHNVFSPHIQILNASVESLNEFLCYFPEKRDDLQSLRNLQSEVIKAVVQSTSSSSNVTTTTNTSTSPTNSNLNTNSTTPSNITTSTSTNS